MEELDDYARLLRQHDPLGGLLPIDGSRSRSTEAFRSNLRAELEVALGASGAADPVWSIHGDAAPHCPEIYRHIGERGLLAPDWPVDAGGLGATWREAAAVLEEFVLAGVPDSILVNSVRNAGGLLLQHASAARRQQLLPGLADGTRVAAILYSEPDHGSDLSGLHTRARPIGSGSWSISGEKRYSVKTDWADVGVCAARTGDSGLGGVSLFIVDLDQPAVTVDVVPAYNVEPFAHVTLNEVVVHDSDLVGDLGGGWSVMGEGLAFERAGLDYNAKARCWLIRLIDEMRRRHARPAGLGLPSLVSAVCAGRSLAWTTLGNLADGGDAYVASALSKLHNSTTAQQVARAWLNEAWEASVSWSPDAGPESLGVNAVRESPGLSLSAGSSEMLLEVVAADLGLEAM